MRHLRGERTDSRQEKLPCHLKSSHTSWHNSQASLNPLFFKEIPAARNVFFFPFFPPPPFFLWQPHFCFTKWTCSPATCLNYWLRDTKRIHKTNKGCYTILLKSSFFVHPIMFGVDYSVSTHPPSLGSPLCSSGIVARQAGWRPWALGAVERKGQWLHLFPIEKDYRSWRPWLITQRQTSEYGQGKVQLFNSSHTQSIQTSCWRSLLSSPCAFFSVTIAFYCLSLPIYGSHNYLGRRSCCNCGSVWILFGALFLLEMGSFLLRRRIVNWLC